MSLENLPNCLEQDLRKKKNWHGLGCRIECCQTNGSVFFFCALFHADELVHEKEKYKSIADEMDTTFVELAGY